MEIESEIVDGWRRIHLRGALVLSGLREVHQKLRSMPGDYSQIIIDLSKVEDLDTAGVQLLIALKREFSGKGRALRLVGHSPAVLEYFALYGLVGFFGDRIMLKKGEKQQYGFEYGLKRESGVPRAG